jgi:hypothetical protein
MEWLDRLLEKWNRFVTTPRPWWEKTKVVFRRIGRVFSVIWKYIYMFRSVFLAAPVGAAAAVLAARCRNHLPEQVAVALPGFDPDAADSVFGFLVYQTQYVTRDVAVMVPLALTICCLLLMLCSKRAFYPWIISIFTLSVPLFLLLTNVYLA